MTFKQTMDELKRMGTAQNVKVYKRHGAGDNLFGVSFANLNALKKKIKTDHDLAEQLWATGNTDAMTLATMVADPKKMNATTAEKWIKGVNYYMIVDLFAGLMAKTSFARQKMIKWMGSSNEFVRQCGYSILGGLLRDGADISDDDCRGFLRTIEAEIHRSPNRARHSMNGALIGIGVYRRNLTEEAIAAARQIGKVEVDHGETSCQTPDAESYIRKALSHGRARVRGAC